MLDLADVNNVPMEYQSKSYASDSSATDHLNTADTFTIDRTEYNVSQVKKISWRGGGSWQGWVLADVWHINFSNGTSLNVVPTQLDSDSWDTLSNLAFPD